MYFYLVLNVTTKDGIFTYDWASPIGSSSRDDRRTGSYTFFDDNELVGVLETLERLLRAFERLLSPPSSSKIQPCLGVVRWGFWGLLGRGYSCRSGPLLPRVERERELRERERYLRERERD